MRSSIPAKLTNMATRLQSLSKNTEGQDATSFKVEPVQASNWQGDASAAPTALHACPPPPPRDAFLEEDTTEPLNGFSAVKLGPPLKSNLKRPQHKTSVAHPSREMIEMKNEHNSSAGEQNNGIEEKRSIKWLDNHGKELTYVREFEPSDSEDSEDEHEALLTSCTCGIQ